MPRELIERFFNPARLAIRALDHIMNESLGLRDENQLRPGIGGKARRA